MTRPRLHLRIALALVLAGAASAPLVARAQYARPGAQVAPRAAAGPFAAPRAPTAPQAQPAVPTTAAPTPTAGLLAPFCFEPMNPSDATLASALRANGLLCADSTRAGDPVRLRAGPGSELTGESGPATVWHRLR